MNKINDKAISRFIHLWITNEVRNWKSFDDMLNQGFCAELATNIWEHFNKSSEIKFHSSDDPVHTWIEFRGRHYDMQNPNGVKNQHNLI